MTEWTELKNRVLIDALKRIDNLGVQYKIIAPDGKEYGTLVVAAPVPEKVRRRGPRLYPFNTLKRYVMPFLESVPPGEQVFIPAGKFDIDRLQSSASSRAHEAWGKGNYRTTKNTVRNGIEVLREL